MRPMTRDNDRRIISEEQYENPDRIGPAFRVVAPGLAIPDAPVRYTTMISDFTLTGDWNTVKHAEEFRRAAENITAQAGKLDVVVTHFPPTLETIDQELYEGDPFNPYFINDAKPLVQYVGAKLWVSGHTHSPFDYQVGATRVVGNPRGYKDEPPRPGFSVMKTVEV